MLTVELQAHRSIFSADGASYSFPVGVDSLASMISGDPPRPEELINAIGLVIDHMEDVVREVPGAATDHIECHGLSVATVVAVEVGSAPTLPYLLGRPAAEEVFRTLATETAADRRRNPGLPSAEVHRVLGACCAIVAILRALQADEIHVLAGHR